MFYHAGPYCLDEEIIVSHSIGAINDLTPGYSTQLFGVAVLDEKFQGTVVLSVQEMATWQ